MANILLGASIKRVTMKGDRPFCTGGLADPAQLWQRKLPWLMDMPESEETVARSVILHAAGGVHSRRVSFSFLSTYGEKPPYHRR
jgi:hypothetical protein